MKKIILLILLALTSMAPVYGAIDRLTQLNESTFGIKSDSVKYVLYLNHKYLTNGRDSLIFGTDTLKVDLKAVKNDSIGIPNTTPITKLYVKNDFVAFDSIASACYPIYVYTNSGSISYIITDSITPVNIAQLSAAVGERILIHPFNSEPMFCEVALLTESENDSQSSLLWIVIAICVILAAGIIFGVIYLKRRAKKNNPYGLKIEYYEKEKNEGKKFDKRLSVFNNKKNEQDIYYAIITWGDSLIPQDYIKCFLIESYYNKHGISEIEVNKIFDFLASKNLNKSQQIYAPLILHKKDSSGDITYHNIPFNKLKEASISFVNLSSEEFTSVEAEDESNDILSKLDSAIEHLKELSNTDTKSELTSEFVKTLDETLTAAVERIRTDVEVEQKQASNIEELQSQKEKLNAELEKAKEEKRKAVAEKEKAVEEATKKLKLDLQAAEATIAKLTQSNTRLENDNADLTKNLNDAKTEIATLKDSIAKFDSLFAYYPECKNIAEALSNYLNEVQEIEAQTINVLAHSNLAPNSITAISSAWNEYRSSTSNICKLISELDVQSNVIKKTGFDIVGTELETRLRAQNASAAREGDFQYFIFEKLYGLMSASIIFADVVAHLDKSAGISSDIIASFKEKPTVLKKLIEKMGFKVNYVELLTKESKYQNIDVIEFSDNPGLEHGTVTKISKVGINFGTSSNKTEIITTE